MKYYLIYDMQNLINASIWHTVVNEFSTKRDLVVFKDRIEKLDGYRDIRATKTLDITKKATKASPYAVHFKF